MATQKQQETPTVTAGGDPTPPAIVNDRIAGTRITVWDIVHYLENNRSHQEIAEILNLTLDQVQAAVRYIKEHEAQVMEIHRQIEERIARGNPPELQARLDAAHARLLEALKSNEKRMSQEKNGSGASGGQ